MLFLSQVYEEFDEEVLQNIRQKVEALRRGKSRDDLEVCAGAVCYQSKAENPYEMDPPRQERGNSSMAPHGEGIHKVMDEIDANSSSEHHYENIFYPVRPRPVVTEVEDAPLDAMDRYPHVDDCEAKVDEHPYENLNFNGMRHKRNDRERV